MYFFSSIIVNAIRSNYIVSYMLYFISGVLVYYESILQITNEIYLYILLSEVRIEVRF